MAKTAKPKQNKAASRAKAVVVMAMLAAVFVVASIVLAILTPTAGAAAAAAEGRKSLFGVQSIDVIGDTSYYPESLIGMSGMYIGQSVFSINKQKIEQELLSLFPYLDTVKVDSEGLGKMQICVTEESAVGAFYADGNWNLIDISGKLLETRPVESDEPPRLRYFKGVTVTEALVPGTVPVIDARSLKIIADITDGMNDYGLTNVVSIDMTDKQDIRLDWNRQITVRLGSDANLRHEIGVVASTIPRVLNSRGAKVTGELNVSSYSDSDMDNQAIFTPSTLL